MLVFDKITSDVCHYERTVIRIQRQKFEKNGYPARHNSNFLLKWNYS